MDKKQIAREIKEVEEHLASLRKKLEAPDWKPGDKFKIPWKPGARFMVIDKTHVNMGVWNFSTVVVEEDYNYPIGKVVLWSARNEWERV